jgi:lipoprotein-anchoring transpeptidase ErfK/SrfK
MAFLTGTRSFVHIDRERHELVLYRRRPWRSKFHVKARYLIAVGDVGFTTPKGMYVVDSKSLDPWWQAPTSDWVDPEIQGVKFPPGDPGNPLTGAFIKLWNGIGIHGTRNIESLGTDASHGCIRMSTEDVLELYPLVPVGCPVYIR